MADQDVYDKDSLYYVITLIAEQDQWNLDLIKKLTVRGRMDYVDSIYLLSKSVGEAANPSWPQNVNTSIERIK